MKNFITIGLCIALPLFGISCKSELALKKNEINQFADKLTLIIQHQDTAGFVALAPKPTDQFINIVTGKPIDMPIKEEAFRDPIKVANKFEAAIKKIEALIGNTADAQCVRVEYSIDNQIWITQFGVFQFDVTLILSGSGKTCSVELLESVLCKRGVLTANNLGVYESK